MDDNGALKLIKQQFSEKLKDGLLNIQIDWLIKQAEKVADLEALYQLSYKRNNEANARIGELIKERDLYKDIVKSCECNN